MTIIVFQTEYRDESSQILFNEKILSYHLSEHANIKIYSSQIIQKLHLI